MTQQSALRANGQSATYRCARFLDLVEAAAWAAASKPAASPKEYRTVAGEFLAVLEALTGKDGVPLSPWVYLAAQALECTLKAYIGKHGPPSPERRHGRDLINLWSTAVSVSAAAEKKIKLEARPPEWCVMLNLFHDQPFPDRYSGEYALAVPSGRAGLVRALRSLYSEVEAAFQ
jgi:hypothetical protein